ncbi:hypothetical protein ACQPYH_32000 [Kribbella sp. CA-245084]|uniref:hypothetical protein n=1 Tax=Kribbella sp. CA-245084 TaxID=3239940 RepID=UPI003D89F47A
MAESADVVLAYWSEHRQQLRQSESQRAVLTNYVLLITTAVSGFVVQQNFRPSTVALSLFIIVIGIYGAISAAKYHERAEYHLSQARSLTRALVALGALGDHAGALEATREVHRTNYPRLSRLRLHKLWTGLHLAIAAYGVVLTIITLLLAAR